MKQCIISKDGFHQIAWIDVDEEDEGKFTSIKVDGKEIPGYKIKTVYKTDFSKEWISNRSRDYKNMKKRTDI